jgi:hypothetical protein
MLIGIVLVDRDCLNRRTINLETSRTVLLAVLFAHILTTMSGCVQGYDGTPRTASEWHERAEKELRLRRLPEGG